MRHIEEIIVHCSATRPEWMSDKPIEAKINEIRRWHVQDRRWSDIGYHYLIDRDGTLGEGRDYREVGAHVKGHNNGTIGVCLIGGHDASASDAFEEHFTEEQDWALRKFIADMENNHGWHKVTGHNEYAAKGCPGFNVGDWLAYPTKEPFAAPERKNGGFWAFLTGLLRWIAGAFPK